MPRRAVTTKVYERYRHGEREYVAIAPSYQLQAVGFSEDEALQALQGELNQLCESIRDGRALTMTYGEMNVLPREAEMISEEMLQDMQLFHEPELRASREQSERSWGAQGAAVSVRSVPALTTGGGEEFFPLAASAGATHGGPVTISGSAAGGHVTLSSGGSATSGAGGAVSITGGPRRPRDLGRNLWDESRVEELSRMCMQMARAMLPGRPQCELEVQARVFMEMPDHAIRASCTALGVQPTVALATAPMSRFLLMDDID